ncbi:TetR/AcrR family transcriptional regulator [Pseudonocardia sp. NPDC049154]|uniref:TetR/AcrR family transcriptional regulator n=1 Tax=Pseudonocardia sp. NPDC049154 TaxID=3155501 RepID=UPI0033FC1CFE
MATVHRADRPQESGPPDRGAERDVIVEAAYRLLTASAGASVPITAVLAEAGMSTRAFYRHFDSKDALLLAMFRTDSERVLRELRAAAERAVTAHEALHGWIRSILHFAADPRRRSRALVIASDEVRRAKGYRAEQARYEAGQDAALAEILRRGLGDGSLPRARPETDAPLVRAAFTEGFGLVMARPVGADVGPVADGVLSFVDRALGAHGISG